MTTPIAGGVTAPLTSSPLTEPLVPSWYAALDLDARQCVDDLLAMIDEVSPDLSPDDRARVFWRAVDSVAPATPRRTALAFCAQLTHGATWPLVAATLIAMALILAAVPLVVTVNSQLFAVAAAGTIGGWIWAVWRLL